MKTFLLVVSLLYATTICAQTYQLEVDYLNSLLLSKEKSSPEIIIMRDAFNEACDEGKSYPALPYDTISESFNFTYVLTAPECQKEWFLNDLKSGALCVMQI